MSFNPGIGDVLIRLPAGLWFVRVFLDGYTFPFSVPPTVAQDAGSGPAPTYSDGLWEWRSFTGGQIQFGTDGIVLSPYNSHIVIYKLS